MLLRQGLLVWVALAAAACAAEVIVEGSPAEDEGGTAADGATAAGTAACEPCAEAEVCVACYVQGYAETYVCTVGTPAPATSCWSLDELHVDASGTGHTCVYCP